MNQRYYSLDIFRGATVALMILVNNPGSWSFIHAPLKHAVWHGLTPTDLVFPFFLFAVGNAMAFVMPRFEKAPVQTFWKKILKRTFLIFAIGLFLNWYPFIKYDEAGNFVAKPFETLRIMGVLQRIALCYFFASIIAYYLKPRGAFIAGAVILLGYWFLCIALHPSDPYSAAGWFGTKAEEIILGEKHMYHGEGFLFEPEGLMSTPAAIAQVIFGFLIGNYILQKGKNAEMLNGIFVAGLLMIFTGFIWDIQFPINKKIWTSSYTIYTTGLACMVLGVMIWLTEFKNIKGWWSSFFDVFGKNALFIFMLSGIIPRSVALIRISNGIDAEGKPKFLTPFTWFYENICRQLFSDPKNASLMYALSFIVMMWFFAWILHRKRIYIKV